jgi:hypothetical protein
MNPADSEIEPELRTPTPRIFRARLRERVLRWFFLTLAIIAPAVMVGFAYVSQQNWNALKDHGARTTGTIVERRVRTTGKNGNPPRALYEFRAGEEAHRFWENITDEEYSKLGLGAQKEVAYLPESPATAVTVGKLERDGDYSTTAFALTVTAGLVSLIGFGIWLWVASDQRHWRRLIRDGVPVRTTSLTVEKKWMGSSNHVWKVLYEFPLDGVTKSGKMNVDADIGQRWLADPTARATVLYDPHDPERFALYAPLAKLYQIESPGAVWNQNG